MRNGLGELSMRARQLSDGQVVVLLIAVTALSRLPFRTTMLYNWDSANFALALQEFDVTKHFPHPPGYFYYVNLARAFNYVLEDANASYVAESILFSALAVAAVYFLGLLLHDRPTGLIAALLLMSSVTFWSYGTLALPYVALAFFSAIVAALAYCVLFLKKDLLLPLSLLFTLGGGFRPDLLLFLAPLWLAALYRQRPGRIAQAAAIVLIGFLLWFGPTAWLSGGLAQYLATFTAYASVDVMQRYSVLEKGTSALLVNVRDTLSYLFYGLYGTILLLVVGCVGLFWPHEGRSVSICRPSPTLGGHGGPPLRHGGLGSAEGGHGGPPLRVWLLSARNWPARKTWFIIAWLAPMALFYTWIHVGDPGYVFTILPAVLVCAAHGVLYVHRRLEWPQAFVGALVVVVLVANVGIFALHQRPLTLWGIRQSDSATAAKIRYIRDHYSADSVLLVSYDLYRQVSYYLPEYHSLWLDVYASSAGELPLSPKVKNVVLLDERLSGLAREPAEIDLGYGKLYSVTVRPSPGAKIIFSAKRIAIE